MISTAVHEGDHWAWLTFGTVVVVIWATSCSPSLTSSMITLDRCTKPSSASSESSDSSSSSSESPPAYMPLRPAPYSSSSSESEPSESYSSVLSAYHIEGLSKLLTPCDAACHLQMLCVSQTDEQYGNCQLAVLRHKR